MLYPFPLVLGGEDEIRTERELVKYLGTGLYMSGPEAVRFIVIHCSATRSNQDYTEQQLLRDHKARGFRTVGYHFYIRKSGDTTQHRKLLEIGAHAYHYNRCSIGICYEGGLSSEGEPADTRTPAQKAALYELVGKLHKLFPQAQVIGHRDLPGVHKACPCFDVCSTYIFND